MTGRPARTLEAWDDLDTAIVGQLREDGRKSFRAIARSLDIPEATVRFRVKRLLGSKALNIQAFIDWTLVPEHHLADLFLTVEASALSAALEEVVAMEEVHYVASCLGFADIYVQAVFASSQDLHYFIADRLPQVSGFLSVTSLVETAVHKAMILIPTR